MKSNKTILLIFILILLGGGAYLAMKKPAIFGLNTIRDGNTNGDSNIPNPVTDNTNNPAQGSDQIVLTNLKEGDTLDATNGFTVTGKAVGPWYFEASAPFSIYSEDGKLLSGGHIQAQGDWMQTNFVDFIGEIPPFLTNGAIKGYIIFQNDNPSGEAKFDKSFKINVSFPVQETLAVKLYFSNSKINTNQNDCTKVFSVNRVIPKSTAIGALALKEMLKGPTNAEVALGYSSAFGGNSDYMFKSLTINSSGVAVADFAFLPSGGSCKMGEARAQIEQTLKQFSTVKNVKILLKGSEAEALQP